MKKVNTDIQQLSIGPSSVGYPFKAPPSTQLRGTHKGDLNDKPMFVDTTVLRDSITSK